MTSAPDVILIVDDEEPVRRTFREWLDGAGLGADILAAADAESALHLANTRVVDLAVLDWNLGAGNDGLQLLEDLSLFNPDIAAVMVTGYAHQATPLKAMRMGVRDFLDKNQELDRETLVNAVRKQLERLRPAKREKRLHRQLVSFRETVEKLLPLARASASLGDPLSPPEAISSLVRFLQRVTGAADGVLFVRAYDASRTPAETCRAYAADGSMLDAPLVPFPRSLAGAVFSMGEARRIDLRPEALPGFDRQPFELGRSFVLAAPLPAREGVQVVLELFDRPEGFREEDRAVVAAASSFGGEVLRHALAERSAGRALLDAVAAALGATDSLRESLSGPGRPDAPPPDDVLRSLERGLSGFSESPAEAVELAESVRVLAVRHGADALKHCIELVRATGRLLDRALGVEEGPP